MTDDASRIEGAADRCAWTQQCCSCMLLPVASCGKNAAVGHQLVPPFNKKLMFAKKASVPGSDVQDDDAVRIRFTSCKKRREEGCFRRSWIFFFLG